VRTRKNGKERKARDLYLAGAMMFEELRDETTKNLLKQVRRPRNGPPLNSNSVPVPWSNVLNTLDFLPPRIRESKALYIPISNPKIKRKFR